MCAAAIEELYGSNDECANAVQQLLASNQSALGTILSISGCQERAQTAIDNCNINGIVVSNHILKFKVSIIL